MRKWENLRLFIDPQFTRLRDALKAKEKELKKQGRGNKPNATTAPSQKRKLIFSLKKKGLGNKFSTIATDCVRVRQDTT